MLRIDPEKVMTRGNNIKRIYEKYNALMKEVENTKDAVGSAWEGADSAGYLSAIESYKEDFKKLGEVIEQLGDITYRAGQRGADSRDMIKAASAKL